MHNFFHFTHTQPYPPPRGCILVQKKSQCCPYLSCSKYHVNFYKNSQKNHEHVYNNYQITHEKTLEKHYRTDDAADDEHHDDVNGGKRAKIKPASAHENNVNFLACFQVALKVEVFMHQVILNFKIHKRRHTSLHSLSLLSLFLLYLLIR